MRVNAKTSLSVAVLLTAFAKTGAAQAPAPAEGGMMVVTTPGEPSRWEYVGITAGGVNYTTSYTTPFDTGRYAPADSVLNRGAWLGVEAQLALITNAALAGRVRFGWLSLEPRSNPVPPPSGGAPLEDDSFDPQLGDENLGGTAGLFARLRGRRMIADLGATLAFNSFRSRAAGGGVAYGAVCEGCDEGKYGYEPLMWWPTVRLSRTGLGFFFSLGTGEGFIHTHERTLIELLVGARLQTWGLMAGISRGLAARADIALSKPYWLSFDVSFNPFAEPARGYAFAPLILSATISWRSQEDAPL